MKFSTAKAYGSTATEHSLELAIAEYVARNGGRCWHVRDSRGMNVVDMPDLLIILPPMIGLIELKSQRRKVTAGQHEVLRLISECRVIESGIVRPIPQEGEMSLDDVLEVMEKWVTWDS